MKTSLILTGAMLLGMASSVCSQNAAPLPTSASPATPAVTQFTVTTSRIWDGAYCAFTSLIQYRGRYYCAFREASSHLFDADGHAAQGVSRIIVSDDGVSWRSAALLVKDGLDLRDPKLSVTPDGRLMVVMGGSVYDGRRLVNMHPQVSFSSDGVRFSAPEPLVIDPQVCEDYEWVWRVTWHDGVGYGVSYGKLHNYVLLRTTDGVHYSLVTHLDVMHNPGETTLRFLSDGRMLLIARREGGRGNQRGILGLSEPPYTQWQWHDMNVPLGGPDVLLLNDSSYILGTRSLYASEKTMLLKGYLDGQCEEVCILPSGGDDNSYPGMIVVGDELWVTYYSRHESDNAAIYLSRVPLSLFSTPRSSAYFNKYW
ncbi:MAG: hypothetical protein AUK63_303 [bacterium P3]|nr:MAG: hypothetical protein AUK63_303 [bacterium P3]KWW42736.1 MAG: hypothetical protein F083_140 [bacterium F083]